MMKRASSPGIVAVPAGREHRRVGPGGLGRGSLPSACLSGFFVLLLLLAGGCAGVKTQSTEVFRSDTIRVALVEEADKSGKVLARGYAQPWNVEAATLNALLESIRYRGTIMFFQQKTKGAFPLPEREQLLKPLQEAFSRASPDQAVEFSFEHRKRWTIFQREYRTDGLLFVKDGKFNCAFRNLAFEEVADPEAATVPFEGDPTRVPSRTGWTLAPEAGQSLVEADSGEFLGPKVFHNWIRLDLSRPWVSPAEPLAGTPAETVTPGAWEPSPVPAGGAVPGTRAEVEKQLDFLEELHGEGAVPDSTYQKKKQDLLDRLNALPAGVP